MVKCYEGFKLSGITIS